MEALAKEDLAKQGLIESLVGFGRSEVIANPHFRYYLSCYHHLGKRRF